MLSECLRCPYDFGFFFSRDEPAEDFVTLKDNVLEGEFGRLSRDVDEFVVSTGDGVSGDTISFFGSNAELLDTLFRVRLVVLSNSSCFPFRRRCRRSCFCCFSSEAPLMLTLITGTKIEDLSGSAAEPDFFGISETGSENFGVAGVEYIFDGESWSLLRGVGSDFGILEVVRDFFFLIFGLGFSL